MAYQTRDVVEAMVGVGGTPITELRVDGGASAMDAMLQFQADLLGVAVSRPVDQETTALGAAFLAGLAEGLFRDLDDDRPPLDPRCDLRRRATNVGARRRLRTWLRAVERSRASPRRSQPPAEVAADRRDRSGREAERPPAMRRRRRSDHEAAYIDVATALAPACTTAPPLAALSVGRSATPATTVGTAQSTPAPTSACEAAAKRRSTRRSSRNELVQNPIGRSVSAGWRG